MSRIFLSRRFHQRGSAPGGALTLGLPDYDAMHSWQGKPFETPALLNFSRLTDYDSANRPDFEGYTFSIADTLYQNIANSIGVHISADQLRRASADMVLPLQGLLEIKQAAAEWLDHCASGSPVSSFADLEIQENFLLSLLSGIQDATTPATGTQLSTRQRAVRRAVGYINETRGPLLVSEVYSHSLASWKTLERGFLECFGISPKKYIIATRMVGARRALLASAPDTRIADIANEWGFFHFGRFAADYKTMFGELPSETRRS